MRVDYILSKNKFLTVVCYIWLSRGAESNMGRLQTFEDKKEEKKNRMYETSSERLRKFGEVLERLSLNNPVSSFATGGMMKLEPGVDPVSQYKQRILEAIAEYEKAHSVFFESLRSHRMERSRDSQYGATGGGNDSTGRIYGQDAKPDKRSGKRSMRVEEPRSHLTCEGNQSPSSSSGPVGGPSRSGKTTFELPPPTVDEDDELLHSDEEPYVSDEDKEKKKEEECCRYDDNFPTWFKKKYGFDYVKGLLTVKQREYIRHFESSKGHKIWEHVYHPDKEPLEEDNHDFYENDDNGSLYSPNFSYLE